MALHRDELMAEVRSGTVATPRGQDGLDEWPPALLDWCSYRHFIDFLSLTTARWWVRLDQKEPGSKCDCKTSEIENPPPPAPPSSSSSFSPCCTDVCYPRFLISRLLLMDWPPLTFDSPPPFFFPRVILTLHAAQLNSVKVFFFLLTNQGCLTPRTVAG